MSFEATTWVWDNSRHQGSTLLLLLAMARHAHKNGGSIFPSVATLATTARVTERQAQKIIRSLEKSGEVVRERPGGGRKHTARWRVVMEKPAQPAPVDGAAPRRSKKPPVTEEFTPEQIERNQRAIDEILNGLEHENLLHEIGKH